MLTLKFQLTLNLIHLSNFYMRQSTIRVQKKVDWSLFKVKIYIGIVIQIEVDIYIDICDLVFEYTLGYENDYDFDFEVVFDLDFLTNCCLIIYIYIK